MASDGNSVVCALYDGDYHLGLGALINSLHACGFRGDIWVGYRGALPPWATPIQTREPHPVFELPEGGRVFFVEILAAGHLTHRKASFMLDIWDRHAPESEAIFYFDVDIVTVTPWPFFEHWAKQGIGLCMDVSSVQMSDSHPVRGYWRQIAQDRGFACRPTTGYINAGFVAAAKANRRFVALWNRFIEDLPNLGKNFDDFHTGDRSDPLMVPDQDLLNVTMMASDCPLSIAGPEAMGFYGTGGAFMFHAIQTPKPWRKRYLRSALAGAPPTEADRAFWNNVASPIPVYAPGHIRRTRMAITLARAIGRFYRRG